MIKNLRLGAFVGLIFLVVPFTSIRANSSLVENLLDIPLPQGASIEWVSKDVSHNGSELIIARYDSPLSLQETIEFYQYAWTGNDSPPIPGFIKMEIDNWLLISRFRGNVNTVIQLDLREFDHSTGFISSVDISRPVTLTTSTNSLSGVELLSHTSSNDEESTSLLSVYQSGRSLESLSELMIGKFQGEGWEIIGLRPLRESKVVSFRRSDWGKFRHLEMVVSRSLSGGSLAVINEVTYDG